MPSTMISRPGSSPAELDVRRHARGRWPRTRLRPKARSARRVGASRGHASTTGVARVTWPFVRATGCHPVRRYRTAPGHRPVRPRPRSARQPADRPSRAAAPAFDARLALAHRQHCRRDQRQGAMRIAVEVGVRHDARRVRVAPVVVDAGADVEQARRARRGESRLRRQPGLQRPPAAARAALLGDLRAPRSHDVKRAPTAATDARWTSSTLAASSVDAAAARCLRASRSRPRSARPPAGGP